MSKRGTKHAHHLIALALCCDISDVKRCRYQSTRTPMPIYTIGDEYFCAPIKGGKPPEGFGQWKEIYELDGRTVYNSTGQDDDTE